MNSNINSSFNVLGADDTNPPTVTNLSDVSPLDNATSVATSAAPSVTFSEAIDPRSLTSSSFFLIDDTGVLVDTTLSLSTNATTVTLTPTVSLQSPKKYYIVGTTAIRDLSGGNSYDGAGGELTEIDGILQTCFSTSAATCY
jgi:hypothetical protein